MATPRKDEILEKALSSDSSAVPRYNLRNPNGTLIGENVALELANAITQRGTPVNAATLNEMLAASGVTGGTSTAYTLAQDNFALFDCALVRFKLHVSSGNNPTLNINRTGEKPIKNAYGDAMQSGFPAGIWIDAVYSQSIDAYVLVGQSIPSDKMARWDAKVTLLSAAKVSQGRAASVNIPSGYKAIRVSGCIGASTAKHLYTDVNGSSYRGVARWINMATGQSGKNDNYSDVQDSIGATYMLFNYWIEEAEMRGTIYSDNCVGSVKYDGTVTSVGISFDVTSLGGTIIMEGIE